MCQKEREEMKPVRVGLKHAVAIRVWVDGAAPKLMRNHTAHWKLTLLLRGYRSQAGLAALLKNVFSHISLER